MPGLVQKGITGITACLKGNITAAAGWKRWLMPFYKHHDLRKSSALKLNKVQ